MTASEFAFLALGLVLGVASGSALVVVLGSRPPAREVKLTVEHDAVHRRAATLSSDAFTAPGEPARGGPADRRRLDRDVPLSDPPFRAPGVPVMSRMTGPAPVTADWSIGVPVRTIVPSGVPKAAPSMVLTAREAPAAVTPDAIPIVPDRDPLLDTLRIQAVLAAERAQRAGQATATALLETRPISEAAAGRTMDTIVGAAAPAEVDSTSAVVRILRGDHRALLGVVAVLAGADDAMRRPWQAAISGLAEGVVRRAIAHGVLDFPVGNPFWDTFTTGQCRAIASALAATGFRFDGIDGWEDERIPSYRDLATAVAGAGLEPRRIRAWPTQDEIAALYREVTAAADEFFARQAPEFELDEVRELAGSRSVELELLWRHWDLARPVLAGPVASS